EHAAIGALKHGALDPARLRLDIGRSLSRDAARTDESDVRMKAVEKRRRFLPVHSSFCFADVTGTKNDTHARLPGERARNTKTVGDHRDIQRCHTKRAGE